MKLNKRVQNAYGSGKAAKSGSDAADDPEKSPDTTADGSPLKKSATLNPSAVAALAAGNGVKSNPGDSSPPPATRSIKKKPASSDGSPGGGGKGSRADADTGFLKTGVNPAEFIKIISKADPDQKPSLREIAGFLMLMGQDQAAKILALLPDDLVEAISLEISKIKVLRPEESKKIIERFHIATLEEQKKLRGGREFAQDLLERSVGRRKAAEILERNAAPAGIDQLEFLNELEANQLKVLLKDEPPRLIGIILSHLEAKLAAALLRDLPDGLKPQVVKTMGEKVKLSAEVMHNIAKAIKGKIRRVGTQQSEYLDGPQILAEILRSMDASSERTLLEDLGLEAPEVEAQIKERLFTIERVLHIRDTDLQKILAEMRDEEIALLMKGKDEEIRVRFLKNVSSQRSIAISESYHYMGAVPRKDVDEATRDFIIRMRRLEEMGEIVITRDDDEMVE
jgi:flagellar motor switch protein FliG